MTFDRRQKIASGGIFAGLFVLYAILPSLGVPVFASPDETATAVAARQIAQTGHAYLFLPSYFLLPTLLPALHPRSWVALGDRIAPVGFLGWPWALSFFYRVGGTALLPWVGMLLILSSAWPFFRLLKRFGFWSAWIGTLLAFTFPPLILYANRSLFGNAIVLALGLWALWLIKEKLAADARPWIFFLTGFVCALALAVRPVEGPWLLPWWLWAGWTLRPTRRQWIAAALGALIICAPLILLSHDAYGSWFAFGYRLHDAAPLTGLTQPTLLLPTSYPLLPTRLLPYGFHPRNIWYNVRAFLLGLAWPWTLVTVFAVWAYLRQKKQRPEWWKNVAPPVWLGAWTVFVLFMLYGSGLYADSIFVGAATVGNSFLRYFLPIAAFVGWGSAYLWHEVERGRFSGRVRVVSTGQAAIGVAVFLAVFGIHRAVWADAESLAPTRRELASYVTVRQAASRWFASGDVILSERSDKIFFPEFQAASPLPPWQDVSGWARASSTRFGLFARPLSQQQKDAWLQAGFEPQELLSFPRENLYRLVPR